MRDLSFAEARARSAFLGLVLLQAAHSLEEYAFRFYEAFPPARFVDELLPGLARPGFVAFNLLLVALGILSYGYIRKANAPRARLVLWIWIVVELYNGLAHMIWGVAAGGYNPGLASAVLLLALAGYLAYTLKRPGVSEAGE